MKRTHLPNVVFAVAPFRLSFGGAADSIDIAQKIGGTTFLNVGLETVRAHVILVRLPLDKKVVVNWSRGKEEVELSEINKIKHDLFREAFKSLKITSSIEAHFIASISAKEEGGTGLGSSGAFMVAILHALHAFKGEDVSLKKLVEEASHIEIDILKKPIGWQDQCASAFGQLAEYRLSESGRLEVLPIHLSEKELETLESSLLLFFVGGNRKPAEKTLQKQKEEREKKLEVYVKLKNLVLPIRESIEKGDLRMMGQLIEEGWQLKRSLSQTTTSQIDEIHDFGLENGAFGGRLLGAGGGGHFLFVVPKEKQKTFRSAFQRKGLRELHVRLSRRGSRIISQDNSFAY